MLPFASISSEVSCSTVSLSIVSGAARPRRFNRLPHLKVKPPQYFWTAMTAIDPSIPCGWGTSRKSMDVPLLPSFRLFQPQARERQPCFESTHLFHARTRQFACNGRVQLSRGVDTLRRWQLQLATVVWESEKDKKLVLPVPFGCAIEE